MQITSLDLSTLEGRAYHSATVFAHSKNLTEVVMFGGCSSWPADVNNIVGIKTIVLHFSKSFLLCQSQNHGCVVQSLPLVLFPVSGP